MSTTWILVADSSRARLFAVNAGDPAIAEIGDFTNPDGRASGRELSSERPPRTHDRFGAHRHAIEPRTSEHDKAVERFARELDDVLERGRTDQGYQRTGPLATRRPLRRSGPDDVARRPPPPQRG